jgi:hypothetical protein
VYRGLGVHRTWQRFFVAGGIDARFAFLKGVPPGLKGIPKRRRVGAALDDVLGARWAEKRIRPHIQQGYRHIVSTVHDGPVQGRA